jgi:hypothetical protein
MVPMTGGLKMSDQIVNDIKKVHSDDASPELKNLVSALKAYAKARNINDAKERVNLILLIAETLKINESDFREMVERLNQIIFIGEVVKKILKETMENQSTLH